MSNEADTEAASADRGLAGVLAELKRLHDRIEAEGPFVAHAERFLIEARKPG